MEKDLDIDIIEDLDSLNITKDFEERPDERFSHQKAILLDKEDADVFSPMHWPMLDDGKKPSTNALGYKTGTWYQDKIREKQEAERERLEAIEREKQEAEEARLAQERQHELTVAELEKISEDARLEGFDIGHKEGEAQGYNAGFAKGQEDGYQEGLLKGQEDGVKQGLLQGREEGYAKGLEEGLQSGSEMVHEQIERFRFLADSLSNPLRQVDRDVTDEIIYIISRLASVIIKREIKYDSAFLTNTIEKALTLLPNYKDGAHILLSQDDFANIDNLIPKEYRANNNWKLEPSDELDSGDIVVSNDISKIEWRVDDRVDSLLNDFLVNASDVVNSAMRESIDNCPDYDELPKKPLIEKPNLENLKDKITQNINKAPYVENNTEDEPLVDTANTQDEEQDQKSDIAESLDTDAQLDNENPENIFSHIENDPFKE